MADLGEAVSGPACGSVTSARSQPRPSPDGYLKAEYQLEASIADPGAVRLQSGFAGARTPTSFSTIRRPTKNVANGCVIATEICLLRSASLRLIIGYGFMAHGYAKIEGKPMLVLLHADVGIQHASMAIFNAYADRVPIYMIAGNWGHAVQAHNAQDMALMIRDMIKWDDEPRSLAGFAAAAQKAYAIAMMPPMGPTLLVVDEDLQEMTNKEPNLRVPKFRPIRPASGDLGSVREAAKLLVNAENPVIITGRSARTAKRNFSPAESCPKLRRTQCPLRASYQSARVQIFTNHCPLFTVHCLCATIIPTGTSNQSTSYSSPRRNPHEASLHLLLYCHSRRHLRRRADPRAQAPTQESRRH